MTVSRCRTRAMRVGRALFEYRTSVPSGPHRNETLSLITYLPCNSGERRPIVWHSASSCFDSFGGSRDVGPWRTDRGVSGNECGRTPD